MCRGLGWDVVPEKDASILWLDKWETSDMTNLRYAKVSTRHEVTSLSCGRVVRCVTFLLQVGHFLGMRDVSTKCSLGRTLNRMRQEFPLVWLHGIIEL